MNEFSLTCINELVVISQISQLGEQRYENPQSTNLHRVLNSTIEIQNIMIEKKAEEKKRSEGGESEASTSKGKDTKDQKKRPVSHSGCCDISHVYYTIVHLCLYVDLQACMYSYIQSHSIDC